MDSIKCVVVGDGAVGKTCLIESYVTKSFKEHCAPSTYPDDSASISVSVTVDDKTVNLALWDTYGQEEYDRLRVLAYQETNVFLLCFSVISSWSFANLRDKWYLDVTKHCPDVQFIIIGLKRDLRDDPETIDKLNAKGQSAISHAQGSKLAENLNAWKYIECSARTPEELDSVFEEAVRAALAPKRKKRSGKKNCSLM